MDSPTTFNTEGWGRTCGRSLRTGSVSVYRP